MDGMLADVVYYSKQLIDLAPLRRCPMKETDEDWIDFGQLVSADPTTARMANSVAIVPTGPAQFREPAVAKPAATAFANEAFGEALWPEATSYSGQLAAV